MYKFVAAGSLFGIFIGLLLLMISPYLSFTDVVFKNLYNEAVGNPIDYAPLGGSVLAGGGLILFIFMLLGALLGWVSYKVTRKMH